jgi:hypothetical protein
MLVFGGRKIVGRKRDFASFPRPIPEVARLRRAED